MSCALGLYDDWNPLPNVSEKLYRRLGYKTMLKLFSTGITIVILLNNLTVPPSNTFALTVTNQIFPVLVFYESRSLTFQRMIWTTLKVSYWCPSWLSSLMMIIYCFNEDGDLCVINEPFSCSLRPTWLKLNSLTNVLSHKQKTNFSSLALS